jgi:hypothetical protein
MRGFPKLFFGAFRQRAECFWAGWSGLVQQLGGGVSLMEQERSTPHFRVSGASAEREALAEKRLRRIFHV